MMPAIQTAPRRSPAIGADATVDELTRAYPDTVRLFTVCGIDVAANGALALHDVARLLRVELHELLPAVRRAAEFAP